MLNLAIGAEYECLTPNFVKLKREIVETDHDVSQDHKSHQNQSISPKPDIRNAESTNPKSSSHHKNTKTVKESPFVGRSNPLMYSDVFKQSPYVTSLLSTPSFEFQNNKRLLPYSDHLFTMSAGYKVTGDDFARPLKQAGTHRQPKFNQNAAKGTVINRLRMFMYFKILKICFNILYYNISIFCYTLSYKIHYIIKYIS
ncbi:hypothetical protein K0M31_008770 [Melipona bicolor]|uniref:Uncharacterized protein n=1 Tax=Melipona bicolor TaxID=60889 RepID=A0AA40KK95_9HYME|nr:hypothetical protein K0M31_008770 [Melipona bicolor]